MTGTEAITDYLSFEPFTRLDELADPLYWFFVGGLKLSRKASDGLVDFGFEGFIQ